MNSITMSARFRASVLAMFAFALFAFAGSASAATNLISNPGVELGGATVTDWSTGGYGVNTAAFATTTGHTGLGISIAVSGYTDGDAKWFFTPVTVEPGALYTFSNWYKSDVTTTLIAALSGGDAQHPDIYVPVATLLSSGNVWMQSTQQFTPRLGYTKVTFFHVISSNGNLTTDDYSLVQAATAADNTFSKGIVSLTFDDGWTNQYTKGFPLLGNLKSTFYLIGKGLKEASIIDLFTDANASADMTTVATSTGVVWGPVYPDPTIHTYEFSDTYSASSTNSVIVTYTTGNHTATSSEVYTFAAGVNNVAKITLNIPTQPDAGMTIRHTSSGNLSVSAKSLIVDTTGYMTPAMMLALQSAGNEIGGHTESHCNLRLIATGSDSNDPNVCAFPAAGLDYPGEITNGYNSIVANGALNVTGFAYPNGANTQAIRDYIKSNTSFTSARTVDEGYNTKINDPMGLKVEVVDTTSTPNDNIDKVKGWIDTAIANKLWLILVFHQIDDPAALASNGENGGTTPAALSAIVSYLNSRSADIDVKTVRDAFALTTGITPADTTAPVIAAHADVFATATSSNTTVAVTYTNPTATDTDPATVVTCTPASGSLFTIGSTTVTCNAHDTANNNATPTTFVVGVSAAPVVTPSPVIEITPATIPSGTTGVAYSQVLAASTTLTGTFVWSVSSGTLPAGFSLGIATTSSNVITGTPAAASVSNFTIQVGNGTATTTQNYTLTTADPAPVTPPSSGGTGNGSYGGGGVVGNGSLSLGYVYVNPTGPITTTPGSVLGAATCFVFTKNLTVGSTGAEVTALQNRLAVEGLFSAGATGYFGSVTKASVMAYQKKNGIEQLGNTGPKTRAMLNATCATTPAAPAATGAGSVLGSSTFAFTQNLALGSTGEEVNELQKILIALGFLKIAAPTGYFGALTKVGVSDYQMSRGIEAIGSVGPKTRAALNSNAAAVSAEK